ncbi:MAG: Rrf2 family transcriptional regulator [Phycisphaerales bacterium]|nr:Rrf2 family transcriptional regulator [Phycisphaerales bacterium]
MVHLASLAPETAHNSEVIARRTGVPRGCLSKILRDPVLARLIRSRRGPNGGFTLARTPEDISILDVINAVDPSHRQEPHLHGAPFLAPPYAPA